MEKVTIKQVAEVTGLSITSVSLVLNNKPCRISATAREKILKAAKELNYHPNSAAVLLKTQRSKSLGLIVPDIHNEYFSIFAQGMEDACHAMGWTLILCTTNGDLERERQYINLFYSQSIDGLCIINAAALNKNDINALLGLNIPIVQNDRTSWHSSFNLVTTNHQHGGYIAVKHLLSLGHRDIAFVTGPSSLEGSNSRLKGCKKAFQDINLPWNDELVFVGDYTYNSGQRAIDSLINKNFSAVFAFNDLMACGVYNALSKYNLSVPQDISVVGYDNIFLSQVLSVPMTTVKQPIYEMGQEAANILIHQTNDASAKPVIHEFDLELITRASVRPLI